MGSADPQKTLLFHGSLGNVEFGTNAFQCTNLTISSLAPIFKEVTRVNYSTLLDLGVTAMRIQWTLSTLALALLVVAVPAAWAGDTCGVPAECGAIRAEIGGPAQFGVPFASVEDEYLVGDWDGDGCDDIAVRRGGVVLMSTDKDDGVHDLQQQFGNGNSESEYLVGDWNADGCDDLAVRRDDVILYDTNFDGAHDGVIVFGDGDAADEYVVAELNRDGLDDLTVRTGNRWVRDLGLGFDGVADGMLRFGNGRSEDQYLVGRWDPDDTSGRQTHAVRRGNRIFMNYNHDSAHDFIQQYGLGDAEDEYLVGDWDGDGFDNIAVRRGNRILMDTNYTGGHEIFQIFGTGTAD